MSNDGASARRGFGAFQEAMRAALRAPGPQDPHAGPDDSACGLHDSARATLRPARRRRGTWRAARALGAVALMAAPLAGRVSGAAPAAPESSARAVTPARPGTARSALAPPFARAPLDTPLVMTGKFGERRSRHFHAGLDLSVGGVVGAPVYAPADGWIERVRTQGVGYGRSLYLRTADDRLVVLAHLEAFDGEVAAYVAAAQDSAGLYEQDLWPARGRFPVRAGRRVAWAVRSGTSAPHLHVEVRRGDLAMNPLFAGIAARDLDAPELRALTLEPLDAASWVERGAGPLTLALGAGPPETLRVEGRVRALVRAVDPGERGALLAPWRLRLEWRDDWVEWRADSASWVSDMADVDFVYDSGRAAPEGAPAIQLWSPAWRRPAMLAGGAAEGRDGGLIEVAPGDPPRPLRLEVEDAAGRVRRAEIWLRGPATAERGPGSGREGMRGAAAGSGGFRFASLPGGNLRISYRGAPPDLGGAALCGVPAARRAGEWHAVLGPDRLGLSLQPVIEGARAGGGAWRDSAPPLAVAEARAGAARSALSPLEWSVEPKSLYEPAVLLYDVIGRPAEGTAELAPVSGAYRVEPASLPLRSGLRLRLDARRGELDPRAGLYVAAGDGWDWVGGPDPARAGSVSGDTRRLGAFAAMVDTLAPRIATLRPPRRRGARGYPTWALRARVTELGSGVDARASFFTVDGRRVPSEYDAVRRTLVWRPLAAPARGAHRYAVEVRDRAGNVRRAAGSFVLD